MKNKGFIFALLFSMVAITGAWAQNLPANIWASPQSTTTEGRYRSNADDFIRPDSYAGVKFNKWFGMVSFLEKDAGGEALATFGFATKVNNIYIGTFYSGDFWTKTANNFYAEKELALAPNGGVAEKAYKVYDTSPQIAPNSVNNVAVLIGVADMGFRLTYRTNYQEFKDSNIVVGASDDPPVPGQLYKNYNLESGYIAPQIAWAMAKDLTKNGIRPYLSVDLVFIRDYGKMETTGPDSLGNTGEKIDHSLNHFDPSFAAGLGGYTLYNKDGFKLSGDLDYVLTFNIYDNEYSYTDNGVYKTAKIKGTYTPASIDYFEKSYVSNLLTPSLSGSWSKDALALKFKLNLPVTLSTDVNKGAKLDSLTQKLYYQGVSKSSTIFNFRPDIRFAMQYKIVPNRLTLNTGARIQATEFRLETVDNVYYDNGIKKSSEKRYENTDSGGGFVSRFHIGPTINLTENAWIEATTGVTNAYGSKSIEVFETDGKGLFSFGSILIAFKF